MKPTSHALKQAQKRYHQKTMLLRVRVNPELDKEVYEKLIEQVNMSKYVKDLIRQDIVRVNND